VNLLTFKSIWINGENVFYLTGTRGFMRDFNSVIRSCTIKYTNSRRCNQWLLISWKFSRKKNGAKQNVCLRTLTYWNSRYRFGCASVNFI